MSGSPVDTHAGVGFVVSPKFRFFVQAFKPINSRICELTINSSPRLIKLYSVYAPSMMSSQHSPEEDTQRKDDFWQALTTATLSNTPYFPIIAGDLNTRLTAKHTSPKIGPCLFGKEPVYESTQHIPNSEYLLEFLDTNAMFLPSTFRNLLNSRRITYKEIDCSEDYSSSNPKPGDFSVLDYFFFPDFCSSGIG